jgi:hypothetical protein
MEDYDDRVLVNLLLLNEQSLASDLHQGSTQGRHHPAGRLNMLPRWIRNHAGVWDRFHQEYV